MGSVSIGRGSVGPDIVGRRRELDIELVLGRGSTGDIFEFEFWRVNHFVGLEKKPERPEGDAERVIEGKEGEGRAPCCCGY